MQLGGNSSEKCGKKGISVEYQWVVFPFSVLTVVYKLARQPISSIDTAEKNDKFK